MVDNLLQGLVLLAAIVLPGEVDLVVGELVATVSGDETLGVNQVEAGPSLILSHALTHEESNNLFSNADTGTSRTEEDSTVILARKTRALHGVDDSTQDDGTRALDIIVEARVNIAVALQGREGVLEVFELNDNAAGREPIR